MTNEEKELFKFVNDPRYREKVIARIHKEKDNEYNKRIKLIESERDKLSKNRINEIKRITNARWEKYAGGKLMVNRTEGKIRINNSEALFSSIQGAELNMINGCRIVTTENTKAKSKKHASLGGAVVGGMISGPIGAVVGGSVLGKTTTKTTGSTVSNQIPTCTHLGVLVNINGFVSEVVFISSQIDQASIIFSKAQREAQNLISQLGVLAKTAVPASFLKPEEESSVKIIEGQIERKQQELQSAIADKPVYALPNMYRTGANKEMSDEEYIQYLANTDAQRMAARSANEAAFKQEKAAEKAKRAEEKRLKHDQVARKNADSDISGKIKLIGTIIYKIIFWILSLFVLIFALAGFVSDGGALSGILFLLTAICTNPLVGDLIRKKLFNLPKWSAVIILFVGFIAGVLTFPTASDATTENAVGTTKNIELDA